MTAGGESHSAGNTTDTNLNLGKLSIFVVAYEKTTATTEDDLSVLPSARSSKSNIN